MTDKIVVFCTCSSAEEAGAIARRLVEDGLAACVNILPGIRSTYRWQGKVESAEECLLMIKSSRPLFAALCSAVETLHSYEVPELIAVAVVDGALNYLEWLQTGLRE